MTKTVSPKRTALGKSKRSKKHSPMGPRPTSKKGSEEWKTYMKRLRSRRKSPMRKSKKSKKSPMRKSKKSKKSPTRKSKKSKKSRK